MRIIESKIKFTTGLPARQKTDKIILHHAAGDNLTVQQIDGIHKKNGFSGVGYHYYIRNNGDIYIGRPERIIGAHCKGSNSTSIGICLEGDFRKRNPTPEQLKSLRELVFELVIRYNLDVKKDVYNHRDLFPTLCPVYDLKSELNK